MCIRDRLIPGMSHTPETAAHRYLQASEFGTDVSVSYTHLDVYKRQPYTPGIRRLSGYFHLLRSGEDRNLKEATQMAEPKVLEFDNVVFLASAGRGRRIVHIRPRLPFFSQGGDAEAIFYLQKGRAKLTICLLYTSRCV